MHNPHAISARLTDSSTSWFRAGALSGFAFTVFLALAWFLNGAETPHYLASNHDWTTWANNTEMKGRVAAFFALLAGLTFLPFAATVRALLGSGEADDEGSVRLAQIAYAGGLIGMTSFAIATVTFSGASAEGSPGESRRQQSDRHGRGGAVPRRANGLCRVPRSRRTGGVAHRCPSAMDGGHRADRRDFLHDHLSYNARWHRRRQRVWLRLLPRNRGAPDLVDCDKHRRESRAPALG